MKKSCYNFMTRRNGQFVLYNTASDEIAILSSEVAELYNKSNEEEIKQRHPDFYNFLQQKHFLVANQTNEIQSTIDKWEHDETDSGVFSIFINPTLHCNMRCWYCYEQHEDASGRSLEMTDDVLNRIFRLIEQKFNQPEIQYLQLGFFGGEPLIGETRIIRPILDLAQTLRNKTGKCFGITFTSNGYLITKQLVEYLLSLQCTVSFQITLDGNRSFHNQVKQVAERIPTYDKILKNIELLCENDIPVNLRFNYTSDNAESFTDVLSDLSMLSPKVINNLSIDFHQVWQDVNKKTNEITHIEEKINLIKTKYKERNFNVVVENKIDAQRCYADTHNHVLVNFDGLLYSCTARDFTPANSEGSLSETGEINWSNKHSVRLDSIKKQIECKTCLIFPICHSGCSQTRIEINNAAICLKGYTSSQKQNVIERRIDYIISKQIQSSK